MTGEAIEILNESCPPQINAISLIIWKRITNKSYVINILFKCSGLVDPLLFMLGYMKIVLHKDMFMCDILI